MSDGVQGVQGQRGSEGQLRLRGRGSADAETAIFTLIIYKLGLSPFKPCHFGLDVSHQLQLGLFSLFFELLLEIEVQCYVCHCRLEHSG